MKKWLRNAVLATLLLSLFSGTSALAQGKIGTVDLRKLFDNYWKRKQAEAQLKERQAGMEKEDKNMLEDYKKLKDDYTSLLASANDQAVSTEERDRRKKAAEDKFKQMKDQEDLITTYERQARTTIGEQVQRMRSNILGEIRAVINSRARAAGFTLVLDTAAESINNTPILLYTINDNDITDAVLKELNAAAPPDTLSKPDDKPTLKLDQTPAPTPGPGKK